MARGVPRKGVSWQFPIVQKPSLQNIGEPVKRNSNPVAFEKTFPRIPWLCFQGEECSALLLDRNVPNSEYALPTGRGSSCFRHKERFQTTSKRAPPHTPLDPPAQLGEFAHRGFRPGSEVHNRDREHRSGWSSLERASRLLAIRTLTDRTISAALRW